MLSHRYQYSRDLLRQYQTLAEHTETQTSFQQLVEQARLAHASYKIVPSRIRVGLDGGRNPPGVEGTAVHVSNENDDIKGTIVEIGPDWYDVAVSEFTGPVRLWGATFRVTQEEPALSIVVVNEEPDLDCTVLECRLQERAPKQPPDEPDEPNTPEAYEKDVFRMFNEVAIPTYQQRISTFSQSRKRLGNLGAPAGEELTPAILSAELCDHVHGAEYWKGLARDIIMKNLLITTDIEWRLPLGNEKTAQVKAELFRNVAIIRNQFLRGDRINLTEGPFPRLYYDDASKAYARERVSQYAATWAGWFTSTFAARGHILSAGVRVRPDSAFCNATKLEIHRPDEPTDEPSFLCIPTPSSNRETPNLEAREADDKQLNAAVTAADEFERLTDAFRIVDDWSSQELGAVFDAVLQIGLYRSPEAVTPDHARSESSLLVATSYPVDDDSLHSVDASSVPETSGGSVASSPPSASAFAPEIIAASTPNRSASPTATERDSSPTLGNTRGSPVELDAAEPESNWTKMYGYSDVRVAFDPLLPLLRHVGGFDILDERALVIPHMVQLRGHSARLSTGQAFPATLMRIHHPQLLRGTSLYERCKSSVRSVWRRRSNFDGGRAPTTVDRRKFLRTASSELRPTALAPMDECYNMVADAILAQFHVFYPPGKSTEAPTRHRLERAAQELSAATTVLVESVETLYPMIDALLSPSNTLQFQDFCRLYSLTEPLDCGILPLRPVFPSGEEQMHHLETVQMMYSVPTFDLDEKGRWFIGGEIDDFMEGLSMARSVRRVQARTA